MPDIAAADATGRVDSAWDGWSRALEELEAELGAVLVSASPTTEASSTTEAGSATETSPTTAAATWTPPSGLGPIPAELEGRARELLAGQRELVAELEHTKRATATQLAALRKVPAMRPTGASVYLDTHG